MHGDAASDEQQRRVEGLGQRIEQAPTQLVTRLEVRGLLEHYLCPTHRRGIYTNDTEAGLPLLDEAQSTDDAALREALNEAARTPEQTPLIRAVESLNVPA